MGRRATIREVAELAGVSVATVSRVINGAAVAPETAARVGEAVAVLGYRPNGVGRSLKTASSRLIGVLIPSLANPVFAEAVDGIAEGVDGSGYSLLFGASDYRRDRERAGIEALLRYRVDGLVLTVADAAASEVLDLIEAVEVPYVLVYNPAGDHRRPTVTVDNRAAGRAVAERLIGLGHRRLGMIAGRLADSDRARARHAGFAAAAAEAGLPAPTLREVPFTAPGLEPVLAEIFAAPAPPTALFCSNDMLAIAAVAALGALGRAVPDDVSVVGFDGIAIGTLVHPSLATVVQPSRELGRTAAQQLLGRLSGEGAAASVILPHVLRHGKSVGPAAKHSPTASPASNLPAHSLVTRTSTP